MTETEGLGGGWRATASGSASTAPSALAAQTGGRVSEAVLQNIESGRKLDTRPSRNCSRSAAPSASRPCCSSRHWRPRTRPSTSPGLGRVGEHDRGEFDAWVRGMEPVTAGRAPALLLRWRSTRSAPRPGTRRLAHGRPGATTRRADRHDHPSAGAVLGRRRPGTAAARIPHRSAVRRPGRVGWTSPGHTARGDRNRRGEAASWGQGNRRVAPLSGARDGEILALFTSTIRCPYASSRRAGWRMGPRMSSRTPARRSACGSAPRLRFIEAERATRGCLGLALRRRTLPRSFCESLPEQAQRSIARCPLRRAPDRPLSHDVEELRECGGRDATPPHRARDPVGGAQATLGGEACNAAGQRAVGDNGSMNRRVGSDTSPMHIERRAVPGIRADESRHLDRGWVAHLLEEIVQVRVDDRTEGERLSSARCVGVGVHAEPAAKVGARQRALSTMLSSGRGPRAGRR